MQENKDLSSTKYGDQTWRFPSAFPSLTAFLTRAAMAMGEESQWEVAEIAKALQDHTAAWLHISVTVWECASRYWNLRARTFSLEGHHFKSHVALNIWKYFEIYAKNSRSQLASGYSGVSIVMFDQWGQPEVIGHDRTRLNCAGWCPVISDTPLWCS